MLHSPDPRTWNPLQQLLALAFLVCLVSFFPLLFSHNYLYVFSLHFGLLSFALFFLYKKNWKETLASLGIPGDILRNILYFLGGIGGVFLILVVLGGIYYWVGIRDSVNVVARVQELPLFVLLAAVFLAPISEELFFRGFLSPRLGIWLSSLLFALSHLAYGSIAELVTTFVLGAWLTFLYRRSGSLFPCIAIHMAFNLFSILLMKLVLK